VVGKSVGEVWANYEERQGASGEGILTSFVEDEVASLFSCSKSMGEPFG
jgi:hypothetical protein